MSRTRIEVTQADERQARALLRDGGFRCLSCPVALAIRRAVPGVKQLLVSAEYANFGDGVVLDLPCRARRAIRRFDVGRPISPFTFLLDVPDRLKGAS